MKYIYIYIYIYWNGTLVVRAVFGAQAQQAGDSGPKDPQ